MVEPIISSFSFFTWRTWRTCSHKLGNIQSAIDDYTQAINIDPYFAKAYQNRGIARSALGYKQDAIDDFETAANLSKKSGYETSYQKARKQISKLKST
ncbi:tetratricopeptide repeat protein [Nodularia spumigena]|uniref:tetratricopeptide repeat protein n=1 Tax=Nodularia spumigena TaxID=70799 RepID=UPI00232F5AC1|nr:tetratricopeptide repeat protein [Nodularia spumigena]MDB9348530.1 tetratricopeptide repeat protein [Nodularia spumigena CS-588/01]MDB9353572.1 tetratricopeptide repeat protein [Nodularia spumigena CS-588/05]